MNLCLPAFMEMDMMSQFGPVWILGMPFFRYYHTTFDRERKEIRMATAKKNCDWEPYEAPVPMASGGAQGSGDAQGTGALGGKVVDKKEGAEEGGKEEADDAAAGEKEGTVEKELKEVKE